MDADEEESDLLFSSIKRMMKNRELFMISIRNIGSRLRTYGWELLRTGFSGFGVREAAKEAGRRELQNNSFSYYLNQHNLLYSLLASVAACGVPLDRVPSQAQF